MVYLRLTDSKVPLSFLWILTTIILGETTDTQKHLPDKTVINDFLKQYVRPYVQSLKDPEGKLVFRKSEDERGVKKFINKKVSQLKEFLQDDSLLENDDKLDDKLTLEGQDERAVIEFSPQVKSKNRDKETQLLREKTDSFKAKIEKYKKLRSKIKRALKKEDVSNKTRSMVTTTLDEMIAQMIANQCTWNDAPIPKVLRTGLNEKAVLSHVTNNWNEVWEKLKKEYITPNQKDDSQVGFLKKFQDLMNMMNSDLKMLVSKYKVVCHLMDTYDNLKEGFSNKLKDKVLREEKPVKSTIGYPDMQRNDYEEKSTCDHFKICSDELKEFLYDFYVNLNESSVNAVRNYAAMFLRDVSDDGYHEKERIAGIINKTADAVESKVTKLFKRQTNKLKLDSDANKYANMKILYQYVTKTIELVKKAIHEAIEENLKSVREKLMQNIQKDIDVNLDVDLGNLEREVGGQVCPTFEVCNGKFVINTRRAYVDKSKHNVYVQVKLDLDLKKNDTTNSSISFARRVGVNDTWSNNNTDFGNLRVVWTRSANNFNVTRTVPPIQSLVIRLKPKIIINEISKPKRGSMTKDIESNDKPKYVKRSHIRRKQNVELKNILLQNETLSDVLNGLLGLPFKFNENNNNTTKNDDVVKSSTLLVMYKK